MKRPFQNDGMNLLFLLLPKQEVDYAYSEWTVRQVLEKMRAHNYSMIPILDKETGVYLRSITDGDILRAILDMKISFEELMQTPLEKVVSKRSIKAVSIMAEEKDLLNTIIGQNYVPVVDDKGVFIGIVTRKKVLSRFLEPKEKEDI